MWTGSEEVWKIVSESKTVTSLIKQATIAVCFLGKVAEHVTNLVFLFKSLVPPYFASSRKSTRESTIKVWEKYKKFERKYNNVSRLFKNCLETLSSGTVFSKCLYPFSLYFGILGKPLPCEVYFIICEDVYALQQGILISLTGVIGRGILRDLRSSLPVQET